MANFTHRIWLRLGLLLSLGFFLLFLSACRQSPASSQDSSLNIVATTSLVGDVVSQVGGDRVSLHVLLPLGTDPHSFSPTPRDASAISDASLIFANGAGLEVFLTPLLENIGGSEKVIEVSRGITLRTIIDEESGTNKVVDDPHTWMDPNNIIVWVDNIVQALSEWDPQNADYYRSNGQNYQEKLISLDEWIRKEVEQIPQNNRQIVTEHLIFGYFADRYGFNQVGAIIPGFSSLSEPSAQDIAQIEAEIRSFGVRAIFISVGVTANIAQRIADDTGTRLVSLYMHSLSEPGGAASNYLDFMLHDVTAIVEALK